MAIDLSAWKPDLHPRDSKGRFRDKWSLGPKARAFVDKVLASFSPRTFKDDAAVSTHLDSIKKPRSKKQQDAIDLFYTRDGNENIQSTLRANDDDTPVIRELRSSFQPAPDDMIISRVFGPDAFGLPPERIGEVEEWTQQKVLDGGFFPGNVGTPHAVAGPHIEARILIPKGTPILVRGGGTRDVALDPDQPVQLGKFTSDGRGGFYTTGVVTPKSGTGTPPRALGRELRPQDKSPAIEPTPDELARRGLNAEGNPLPEGGQAPGAAPETQAPAAPPIAPEVGAPAAPAGPVKTAGQQLQEAGAEVPVGAGKVVGPDVEVAPRGKIEPRKSIQVMPEEKARQAEVDRREKRIAEAEKQLEARQQRLETLRAETDKRQADVSVQQSRQIEQQQQLIDRLMRMTPAQRREEIGRQQEEAIRRDTRAVGGRRPREGRLLQNPEPPATTPEEEVAAARAQEAALKERTPEAAKKAAKAARERVIAQESQPAGSMERARVERERVAGERQAATRREDVANFRDQNQDQLLPRQRRQVGNLNEADSDTYWTRRSEGQPHARAIKGLDYLTTGRTGPLAGDRGAGRVTPEQRRDVDNLDANALEIYRARRAEGADHRIALREAHQSQLPSTRTTAKRAPRKVAVGPNGEELVGGIAIPRATERRHKQPREDVMAHIASLDKEQKSRLKKNLDKMRGAKSEEDLVRSLKKIDEDDLFDLTNSAGVANSEPGVDAQDKNDYIGRLVRIWQDKIKGKSPATRGQEQSRLTRPARTGPSIPERGGSTGARAFMRREEGNLSPEQSAELNALSSTERVDYWARRADGASHAEAMPSATKAKTFIGNVPSTHGNANPQPEPAKAAKKVTPTVPVKKTAPVRERPPTLTSLRTQAREQKVPGYSRMDRGQLQSALDARKRREGETTEAHVARVAELNAPRKVTKKAAPAAKAVSTEKLAPTKAVTTAQKVAGSRKSRVEAPENYDRFPVPDSKASWGTKFPGYKANKFTADVVKENDETLRPPGNTDPTRYWADPPNVKDVKRPFRSYEGPVKLDGQGRPQNPYTRTGVQDRGELGKWGANFAGDSIVTRVDPDTGRLQMLTIRRKDGQPAIPGGMVDFNEDIWKTRRRELKEETGVDLDMADSREVYKGYVDDPRNTDNAWMETSVGHKHLTPEQAAATGKFKPESNEEIKGVYWADVDPEMIDGLFASHGDFVAMMAEQMLSDKSLSPAERRRLRGTLETRATKKAVAPKKKVLPKAAVKALPDQPERPLAPKKVGKAAVPAKKVSERGQRIRDLRERARADLREQGFDNPSQEMLDEHMAALARNDHQTRDRLRTGGVDRHTVKKTAPVAKKAAPAVGHDILDEKDVGSTIARNNVKDARRDLARGDSLADVADTLRGQADSLRDGDPLTESDMPDRIHHSDEDLRDIALADARNLHRMADELEKVAAKKAAPAKKVTKKATPTKAQLERSAIPDADAQEMLRKAKTVADLNEIAKHYGVRIPSTAGRREERRNFLISQLLRRRGESPAEYRDRIEGLKETRPARVSPAKRIVRGAKAPEARPMRAEALTTGPEPDARVRPNGKIPLSKLRKGDKVLVEKDRNGRWVPATRKTGATTVTVDRVYGIQENGGFRRTTTRKALSGHDNNGNEINVGTEAIVGGQIKGYPGHQTFIFVPEGKAPAKKTAAAAKKATPAVKKAAVAKKTAPFAVGEPVNAQDRGRLDAVDAATARKKVEARAQELFGPERTRGQAWKQALDEHETSQVAQRLRAVKTEEEAITLLAGDKTLTAYKLKKIADELGIDVPESVKAKTSLQLHIAEKVAPAKKTAPSLSSLRKEAKDLRVPDHTVKTRAELERDIPQRRIWNELSGEPNKQHEILRLEGDQRERYYDQRLAGESHEAAVSSAKEIPTGLAPTKTGRRTDQIAARKRLSEERAAEKLATKKATPNTRRLRDQFDKTLVEGVKEEVVKQVEEDHAGETPTQRAARVKKRLAEIDAASAAKATPAKPKITRAAKQSWQDVNGGLGEKGLSADQIEQRILDGRLTGTDIDAITQERGLALPKRGTVAQRRRALAEGIVSVGGPKVAPVKKVAAVKTASVPKKALPGYRDTGEVVPEADRAGLHVTTQRWGDYGVYDSKQHRVEADHKTEAAAQRRVRELQAGDTIKAVVPKERTARQRAADEKEAKRQQALIRAATPAPEAPVRPVKVTKATKRVIPIPEGGSRPPAAEMPEEERADLIRRVQAAGSLSEAERILDDEINLDVMRLLADRNGIDSGQRKPEMRRQLAESMRRRPTFRPMRSERLSATPGRNDQLTSREMLDRVTPTDSELGEEGQLHLGATNPRLQRAIHDAFDGERNGITFKIDDELSQVYKDRDGNLVVRVEGLVKDRDGRIVGGFRRELTPATGKVNNDSFAIDKALQRQGLSTWFNDRQDAALTDHGFTRTITSPAFAGGLSNARRDFRWRSDRPGATGDVPLRIAMAKEHATPEQRKVLEGWLDRFVGDGGLDSYPTPKEISDFGDLGRSIMDGSSWEGEKPLRPSRPMRSEALSKKATPTKKAPAVKKAAPVRFPDDLDPRRHKTDLVAIAKSEGVPSPEKLTKPQIIEEIKKVRVRKKAVPTTTNGIPDELPTQITALRKLGREHGIPGSSRLSADALRKSLEMKREDPSVIPISGELLPEGVQEHLTPANIKAAAKTQGIDLEGSNVSELLTDYIRKTATRGADAKVQRAEKAAARKAQAELRLSERDKKYGPNGPSHIDLGAIAQGHGVKSLKDDGALSDAQAKLNQGNTPAEVAKDLEGFARSRSDSTSIRYGSWNRAERERNMEEDPEHWGPVYAERDRNYELGTTRAKQLRDIATELRGTRRPVAKKAVPAKKAPAAKVTPAAKKVAPEKPTITRAAKKAVPVKKTASPEKKETHEQVLARIHESRRLEREEVKAHNQARAIVTGDKVNPANLRQALVDAHGPAARRRALEKLETALPHHVDRGVPVATWREIAGPKGLGIKGTSRMNKTEIKDAIIAHFADVDEARKADLKSRRVETRDRLNEPGLAESVVKSANDDPHHRRRGGAGHDSFESDRGGDVLGEHLAERQGFDQLPEVLTRDEFEARRKDMGLVLYRGINTTGRDTEPGWGGFQGKPASEVHDEFRDGRYHMGLGSFGNGTYMTRNKQHATGYSDLTEGSIGRYGLAKDAKIIELPDLIREHEDYLSGVDKKSDEAKVFGDLGRYAMARGYDAIHVPRGSQAFGVGPDGAKDQYVVLNRGKVFAEAPGDVRTVAEARRQAIEARKVAKKTVPAAKIAVPVAKKAAPEKPTITRAAKKAAPVVSHLRTTEPPTSRSSTRITPTPTPTNPQSRWGKMRDNPTVTWSPTHGRPGSYDQVDRVYTAPTREDARRFLESRGDDQLQRIADFDGNLNGRQFDQLSKKDRINKILDDVREPEAGTSAPAVKKALGPGGLRADESASAQIDRMRLARLTPTQRRSYDQLTDDEKKTYWDIRQRGFTGGHKAALDGAKYRTKISAALKDVEDAESYEAAHASLDKYSDDELRSMIHRDVRGRLSTTSYGAGTPRERLENAVVNKNIGAKAREAANAQRRGRADAVTSVVKDLNDKKIDKPEAIRRLRDLDTSEGRVLADGMEASGEAQAAEFRDLVPGDTIIDVDGNDRKIDKIENHVLLDGEGSSIQPQFLDGSRVIRTKEAPRPEAPDTKPTIRRRTPNANPATVRKNILDANGPEERREILDAHDDLSITQWRKLAKDLGVRGQGRESDKGRIKDAIEKDFKDGDLTRPKKSLRDQLRDADVSMAPKRGRHDYHGESIEKAANDTPDEPVALRAQAAKFEHDAETSRQLAGMVKANRNDQPDRVRALSEGADEYDKAAKVFRRRADAIEKGQVAANRDRTPETEAKMPEVVPTKVPGVEPYGPRSVSKKLDEATTREQARAHLIDLSQGELEDVARIRRVPIDRSGGEGGELGSRSRLLRDRIIADMADDRPGQFDIPAPEAAARRRQRDIDNAKQLTDMASEIDQLFEDGASPEAMRSRIESMFKRFNEPDDARPLVDAASTLDRDKVNAAIAKALKKAGITRITGGAGSTERFNRQRHDIGSSARSPDTGGLVRVTRPGYSLQRDGENIQFTKAIVEPDTPERFNFRQVLKTHGIDEPRDMNFDAREAIRDAERLLDRNGSPPEIAMGLRRRARTLGTSNDESTSRTQMDPETLRDRRRQGQELLRRIASAIDVEYREQRARERRRLAAIPKAEAPGGGGTTTDTPAARLTGPAQVDAARIRAASREKEARIRHATGSGDLASELFQVIQARRGQDNGDFLGTVRQRIEGATPGDVTNPRDTHARGWDQLKKALGPESGWDTPEKLDVKLRQKLANRGISVDHKDGDRLKFDPATMDTFGGDIKSGDDVEVIRPGLRFTDAKDQDTHVLAKPIVTRVQRLGLKSTPGPGEIRNPFDDVFIARRLDRTPGEENSEGLRLLRDMMTVPGLRTPTNGVERADRMTRRFKKADLADMARALKVDFSEKTTADSIRHGVMHDLRRRLGASTPSDQALREELEKLSVRELKARLPAGIKLPSRISKPNLVEMVIGDGPPGDYHTDMTPGATSLKRRIETGTTDKKFFGGGSMGVTNLLEAPDGEEAVRKRLSTDWFITAKHQADGEQLVSELGERIDAPQPSVYRPTERTVYMDRIPGRLAYFYPEDQVQRAIGTPQGRRIAILDAITGNSDRHDSNWIITPDGVPTGIDNSLGFEDAKYGPDGEILPAEPHAKDLFAWHYPYRDMEVEDKGHGIEVIKPGKWLDDHPFPKEELEDVRKELVAMKPQFQKLEREDWYDASLARLDALIKRAKPGGSDTTVKETPQRLPQGTPQERLSRARGMGAFAREMLGIVAGNRNGSDRDYFRRPVRARVEGDRYREPGLSDIEIEGYKDLQKALQGESHLESLETFDESVRKVLADRGITVEHRDGEMIDYDPATMKASSGDVITGDKVRVDQPGLRFTDPDGTEHVLSVTRVTKPAPHFQRGGVGSFFDSDTSAKFNSNGEITGSARDAGRIFTADSQGIPDEGIPVKDLHLNSNGYKIKQGRFYRIDGVDYLVDHGDGSPTDRAKADKVFKQAREWRDGLDSEVKPYQKSMGIMGGPNPGDERYRQARGVKDFKSLATAGQGNTDVWNYGDEFNSISKGKLDHELGHLVDERKESTTPEWKIAGESDSAELAKRDRLFGERDSTGILDRSRSFRSFGEGYNVRLTPDAEMFASDAQSYKYGVTRYGTSNVGEDYADSVSLYRAGPIGTISDPTPEDPEHRRQVRFRELFPARTAILDQKFPEEAERQKATLAEYLARDPETRELFDLNSAGDSYARALVQFRVNTMDMPQLRRVAKKLGKPKYGQSRVDLTRHIVEAVAGPQRLSDPRVQVLKGLNRAEAERDLTTRTSQNLRDLGGSLGVPGARGGRRTKQQLVDGILAVTHPSEESHPMAASGRARVPNVPPAVGSASVPGRGDPQGRSGITSGEMPFTGVPDLGPRGDTSPEGLPVKGLEVSPGYTVDHGTFYRRNGVGYLVEHEDSDAGRTRGKQIQEAFAAHRRSLPLSVRGYQRGYSWMEGRNPKDKEYADRFKTDGFVSEADSFMGSTTLWARTELGSTDVKKTLDHEFGHNLENFVPRSRRSDSPAWTAAAETDHGARPQLYELKIKRNPNTAAIRFFPVQKDDEHQFPDGVTDYGTANHYEDYAESVRLYSEGPLGTAKFTPDGPEEPVWFRDLFPGRAAILDESSPDFAAQQQAEIAKVRGSSPMRRLSAYRQLVKQKEADRDRTDGFQRMEMPQSRPLRSEVLLPRFMDMSTKDVVQDSSIGTRPAPVRNLTIPGRHGDYVIRNGHVVRHDGVTFIVEHPNGDRNEARETAELERLRTFVRQLPPEMRRHQRSFVLAQGANPDDTYFAEKFNAPGFRSFAGATGGNITLWGRDIETPLHRDEKIDAKLGHEFGHNVDSDYGYRASGSAEWWQAASEDDSARKSVLTFQPKDPERFDIRFSGIDREGSTFPYGVTNYGTVNDHEDFADSLALYREGVVGTGRLPYPDDQIRDVWFRDLFPARAALLDRLFPQFALEQLQEIRRRRQLQNA